MQFNEHRIGTYAELSILISYLTRLPLRHQVIYASAVWNNCRYLRKIIDNLLSMCVASGKLLSATELAPAICYLLPAPTEPDFLSAVWEQWLDIFCKRSISTFCKSSGAVLLDRRMKFDENC